MVPNNSISKECEIIYDYTSASEFCQMFRISYTIKNIN